MPHAKFEQITGLNRTSYRRRTGIYPETFHEMHEVLQAWESRKKKPGRPPALSVAEQLILTLEFWREYRTCFYQGQDWGVHETAAECAVERVESALLASRRFSLPGKRSLITEEAVQNAVLVDVSEVPCERPKKADRPHTGAVLPKTATGLVQRQKKLRR